METGARCKKPALLGSLNYGRLNRRQFLRHGDDDDDDDDDDGGGGGGGGGVWTVG